MSDKTPERSSGGPCPRAPASRFRARATSLGRSGTAPVCRSAPLLCVTLSPQTGTPRLDIGTAMPSLADPETDSVLRMVEPYSDRHAGVAAGHAGVIGPAASRTGRRLLASGW